MQVFTVKKISSFALAAATATAMLCPPLPFMQVHAETQAESGTGTVVVSDETELKAAVADGAGSGETAREITVSGEITLSGPLNIPSGANIVLRGDGEGAPVIKAGTDSSLAVNTAFIDVEGTLTTQDLTVDAAQKGMVLKVEENGSYEAESGTVLKNGYNINKYIDGYGGAIWNAGDCRISGGTVSGCHSKYGGGVFNEGTFTMSGGSVEDNTASYSGGGVFNEGTFTMSGGSVEDNTASYSGGGIYNRNPGSAAGEEGVQEATVLINGETAAITGNEAKSGKDNLSGVGVSCGGGIYIRSGTVTMKSGAISENKAVNCLQPSAIGMDGNGPLKPILGFDPGGAIGCGGGVYVDNYGGSFVMEGGTVKDNQAESKDNGNKVTFLSDRKQEMRGGGVYVQGGSDDGRKEDDDYESNEGKKAGSFSMTGGSITGNFSRGYGSGVCIAGEEYNVYKIDVHNDAKLSCCAGPAGIFLGGNAVISGNLNDDLYLCSGVSAAITESFAEGASVSVDVEGLDMDTVLAKYEAGVEAKESDSGIFALRCKNGKTELRTVQMRELPPEEGQDGETVRHQLYMAGIDISEDGMATLEEEVFPYTGAAVEPEVVKVRFADEDGWKDLVRDTEYRVDYEYESGDSAKPGQAAAVVTGIGNYSGQIRIPFEIQKRSLDDPAVEVTKDELSGFCCTYNGKEQKPAWGLVSLKDTVTGGTLLYNTHYSIAYEDNVNVGTGTVLFHGKGDYYSGTKKLAFTIEPASLDGCSFTYTNSFRYTGQEIEPAVTVKDVRNDLGELQEGTDYTCTYQNNKEVGTQTAEIIITGKGNYTGTRTLKFSITQDPPANTPIDPPANTPIDSPANTPIDSPVNSLPTATQEISGVKASYQKVYGAEPFLLKAKASGGGKLTYTSSDKKVVTVNSKGKVTIKGSGKATVTVKAAAVGQRYQAAVKKVTITVVPKKVAGVSVVNKKAKKLTVKWKRDKNATGYEVQYSTDQKFRKSKTTTKTVSKNTTVKKTMNKLKKGKTYCVRVRSYKKYGKTKLCGAWSSIRKITVFQ